MRGELLADGLGGRRRISVEARQRGLERALSRGADFPPDGIVVLEAERPDERPQGQPLQDERAEDHRERGHEDEIPEGKLGAVPAGGQRERGGQR